MQKDKTKSTELLLCKKDLKVKYNEVPTKIWRDVSKFASTYSFPVLSLTTINQSYNDIKFIKEKVKFSIKNHLGL